MDSASIGGIIIAVISAIGVFVGINHKHIHSRIRSNCCGKVAEASVDYDTSPVTTGTVVSDVSIKETPIVKINEVNKDLGK